MPSALFFLRVAVFLAFLVLLFHSLVDTRLIYDHQVYESAVFAPTWRTFKEFVRAPGDVADWCSRYICQVNRSEWGGPAANAAVIGVFLLLTAAVMRAAARGPAPGAWVAPGLLLMALYGQYDFYGAPVIGIIIAMAAAAAYAWTPIRNSALRIAVFAAMALVVYYLAAGACFLFAVTCAVFEMATARRWAAGAACIPAAVLAAAIIEVLLAASAESGWRWPAMDAFGARWTVLSSAGGWDALRARLMPFLKHSNAWINWGVGLLYFYIPVCAALVPFMGKLKEQAAKLISRTGNSPAGDARASAHDSGGEKPALRPPPAGRTILMAVVQMTVLLGVAAGVAHLTVNRELKREVKIDYWFTNSRWDDILREAPDVPKSSYTFAMNMDVNRALFEKGRLAYDMFSYPQEYQLLAGVMEVPDWHSNCHIADLLLAMGRVNEAEAFAGLGYQGPTMSRLAKIKIIKRDYGSARIFLNVLSAHAEYGAWARAWLQRIDEDPDSPPDEEITRYRALASGEDKDYPGLVYHANLAGTAVVYAACLRVNPHNKMAFEYMMAFCLLEGRVKDVCANLVDRPGRPSRLNEEYWVNAQRFRYPDIPRHYEEAMLIYQDMTGQAVQVPGKSIRPETRKRFEAFTPMMMEYQRIRDQKDGAAKAAVLKRESLRVATQAGNRQRQAELEASIAEDQRREKESADRMKDLKDKMWKEFHDTYFYFYYLVLGERGRQ